MERHKAEMWHSPFGTRAHFRYGGLFRSTSIWQDEENGIEPQTMARSLQECEVHWIELIWIECTTARTPDKSNESWFIAISRLFFFCLYLSRVSAPKNSKRSDRKLTTCKILATYQAMHSNRPGIHKECGGEYKFDSFIAKMKCATAPNERWTENWNQTEQKKGGTTTNNKNCEEVFNENRMHHPFPFYIIHGCVL